MNHAHAFVSLVFIAALVGAAGCGSPGLGEKCDNAGSRDACEDGLVCTNEGGNNVCRRLCTDQSQCPTGHSCNGVSGTNLKSCQPDTK
jgi:hypothetical protein